MEFIYRPRRAGKTTQVANYLAAHPGAVLLVPNTRQARWWVTNFPGLLQDRRIVTPDNTKRGALGGYGTPPIAVDNLDMLLSDLLYIDSGRIGIATWNAPEPPEAG